MEEKFKIHASYILSILLTIIIVLMAVRWVEIPKLVELITFALTLTSLVLALLAIVYAVYSNTSFSQNITTLNNASREISGTAESINHAAEDLAKKIEAIPSRLASMEVKVEQTNVLLKQYSERQNVQPLNKEEEKAASEIADVFLERIALMGLFFLYAYSIAHTKNKPLNMVELSSILEFPSDDYAAGVLTATSAAGLINYKATAGVVNITGVNERILHLLSIVVDKRTIEVDAARLSDDHIGKEEFIQWLSKLKQKIERYFESDKDLPTT